MQFIDAPKVHQLLDYPYLIEFLYQAHLGPHPETQHLVQQEPGNGENQFVTLVGWKRGAAIMVKMVGVFPGNLSL